MTSIPHTDKRTSPNSLETILTKRGQEIEKASIELLGKAKEKGHEIESLEGILLLSLPIDDNEQYDVIDSLQKAAKKLEKETENLSFFRLSDTAMLKDLTGDFNENNLTLATKKVLLYREAKSLIEADVFEDKLWQVAKKNKVKRKTFQNLLGETKKTGKKATQAAKTPQELNIDVLGYDESHRVWIAHRGYIERLSPSMMLKELDVIFGKDASKDLMKQIQGEAAKKGRLHHKRMIGQGIHLLENKWLIVSGQQAIAIDKNTLEQSVLEKPIHNGYLVNKDDRPWIDLSNVVPHTIKNPQNALKECFQELENIVSLWEWRHVSARSCVTAFVMLTLFQQAMNPWRPLIYLSGTQGTGKTMFSQLLTGLFQGFIEVLDKTSAHALKQTFGDNSKPGFLDEFEHYESEKRQKDILNLLKTSCAGGKASFGTTGSKAKECCLSHLFWLASISFPRCIETDGAIRDRLVVFELQKCAGKFIKLPSKKSLTALSLKMINAMIVCWPRLEEKVQANLNMEKLKEEISEDVQARDVQNFAWATALAELSKGDKIESMKSTVVPQWAIRKKEDDASRIIEEILHTKVKDGLNEYFIADLIYKSCIALNNTNMDQDCINLLRLQHITVIKHKDDLCIGIQVTKLRTFFEKKEMFSGLDIKTILERLDFVKTVRVRFGMSVLKALLIPITEINRILGRANVEFETPKTEDLYEGRYEGSMC